MRACAAELNAPTVGCRSGCLLEPAKAAASGPGSVRCARSPSARWLPADVRRDFFEQQREALQHAERAQKAEETVAVLRAHVEDLQARLEGAEADAASARAGRDRLQLENKDAQREMQRLRDQLDAAKDVGVRVRADPRRRSSYLGACALQDTAAVTCGSHANCASRSHAGCRREF